MIKIGILKNKIETKLINFFLRNVPSYYYERSAKKMDISTDIPVFSALAKSVISEGRTYLREDRLYTLFQCISRLPSNAVAIEIGVFRGGGSKFMAHLLQERGAGMLYVCDTFSGHADVDSSIDGGHRVNEGFSNVIVEDVKDYLKQYGNVRFIVGDIVKTSQQIQDKEINLIHLDMDVYPPTKFALEHFWPRIPVGGIIVGDDYGTSSCKGIKKAVDDFVAKTRDCFSIHLITGQVVIVKTGA